MYPDCAVLRLSSQVRGIGPNAITPNKKEQTMNLFVKDLPPDTQILIAVGAAVAAGCQVCLKKLTALARDEGLDKARMRAAATIGQFVKEQPSQQMRALADELLGADPEVAASEIECICDAPQPEEAECCG
jgi:AhpD family alkylhydroperoxidase